MEITKTIGLVAHDNRKQDLLNWVTTHSDYLVKQRLICTGTTGALVEKTLLECRPDMKDKLDITKLKSGPLGGDQQLGARITDGLIDALIFLWDPMQQQPHDVDIKALLRITVLYNVPTACNLSTADFIVNSPLMLREYHPQHKDYSAYITRGINLK